MRLRFGLAAWSNAHFDNALFPLGTKHAERLPRYATVFDCAEADTLHHAMPSADQLQAWVDETPEGFLFLPKMWKAVTHGKEGPDEAQAWLDALDPLRRAGRLGPILVQLPPQAKRESWWDRLLALLALQDAGSFAVEVRNPSWFVPAFENLLEDFDAPLVWGTHPKAFSPPWATASYGYVRFTGNVKEERRGRYVKRVDRLDAVLEMRKRVAAASWKECFVVVTNPFEGNAVDSMPGIAAALGSTALAKRLTRRPGEVWFPDPSGPEPAPSERARAGKRPAKARPRRWTSTRH